MGSFHPQVLIDNKFIEDLNVGTSEEWIVAKIGILTRATTLPLDHIKKTRNANIIDAVKAASITPAEMGIAAAKQALQRAGINASDVGLLICNCCTPNQTIPSPSERIAEELGINAIAHELFTACPAFALHLDFLNNFEEVSLPDYILCVSTAALTQHVDYSDRSDGAIWGDGASAYVVSTRHPGKLNVLETFYTSDPLRSQSVIINTYGYFGQDGRAVRDFSVRQTVRLIKRLEKLHNIDWERDVFIGHQANATMLEQIRNNRKIPHRSHWSNVATVGNQAGAGSSAVLAEHWEEVEKGQKIIVAVVGAGLSWGSLLLEGV